MGPRPFRTPLSLRTPQLSILILVQAAFAAGVWLVPRTAMQPGYLALEREFAATDRRRVLATLRGEIESVDKVTLDCANRDDTCRSEVG